MRRFFYFLLAVLFSHPIGLDAQQVKFKLSSNNFEEYNNKEILLFDVADIDGDKDTDIVLTSRETWGGPQSFSLYSNDGQGIFQELEKKYYPSHYALELFFHDWDVDGDPDLLVVEGTSMNSVQRVVLFTNNGPDDFISNRKILLEENALKVGLADVNGDQRKDIILVTRSSFTIYLRINDNGLLKKTSLFLDNNSFHPSLAFADIDNDEDIDILTTVKDNNGAYLTKAFLNDGDGSFSEKQGAALISSESGDIGLVDIDNDQDLDVLIMGLDGFQYYHATIQLYKNDGQGNFEPVMGLPFDTVSTGSITFSDVDDDGDQDVFLTGMTNHVKISSGLFWNDGQGNFTKDLSSQFEQVFQGDAIFFDADRDFDQDVFIAGNQYPHGSFANLYLNNLYGNPTDSLVLNQNFPNPFYYQTTISFYLDQVSDVSLSIIDWTGKKVDVLYKGELERGEHEMVFERKNYPPGIYVYALQIGNHIVSKKMVIYN